MPRRAAPEGRQQLGITLLIRRLQQVEHGHGDIMRSEPPDRVFKVDGMQHALVELDIVVP